MGTIYILYVIPVQKIPSLLNPSLWLVVLPVILIIGLHMPIILCRGWSPVTMVTTISGAPTTCHSSWDYISPCTWFCWVIFFVVSGSLIGCLYCLKRKEVPRCRVIFSCRFWQQFPESYGTITAACENSVIGYLKWLSQDTSGYLSPMYKQILYKLQEFPFAYR